MLIKEGIRPKKYERGYTRILCMGFPEFFKLLEKAKEENKSEIKIFGWIVHILSERYEVWRKKGIKCVSCGLEAKYVALEYQPKNRYTGKCHFNAYGINKSCQSGYEVMLTRDHILPKSKGGPDTLENYQPMCSHCNNKKGNTITV